METVTMVELIARTWESYNKEVLEFEEKRTGDEATDKLIDQYLEKPKAKCKTLEAMYEIETGRKMWEK